MIRKLFAVVLLLTGAAARADVVTDWNAIASQVISASTHTGPVQTLDFATVHIAMHDAVQSIDGRFRPYHVAIAGASGSLSAAAAAAARAVLVNRFPSQAATINSTYSAYLTANGIDPNDAGASAGEQAAAGIIALRATDGSFPVTSAAFVGGTSVGEWRPTPSYLSGTPAAFSPMASPWLSKVTPFAMKSASQFRSKKPPELTSREYTTDFNEVKSLGASNGSSRTDDQTAIAYFWSDNIPVLWNRTLRSIAATYIDDIGDSARLFALANISAADALIACWETKQFYNVWRPVTAIQEAANDGNPDTQPDPDWKPLVNTPNYPDYASGANDVTAAMTLTLEMFFARDDLPFTITSNVANLAPDKRARTFSRFSDAASEVVDARILLGFHFRFADTAAREQGSRVAKWTFTHELKPTRDEDRSARMPE